LASVEKLVEKSAKIGKIAGFPWGRFFGWQKARFFKKI